MTALVTSFIVSGTACLLLAVALGTSRALSPLCARLLSLNYAVYAIQNLLAAALFSDAWPAAAPIRALLATTLGPLLYLYYLSALRPAALKSRRQLIHLLPPLLLTAVLIIGGRWLVLVDYLIIASFGGYWLAATVLLVRSRHRAEYLGGISGHATAWLTVLTVMMLINLLIEIGVVVEIAAGTAPRDTTALLLGGWLFAMFNLLTLLLALSRAPLIEWMHRLKELQTPRKTSTSEQLRELFQRWEALVEERQLHRSEENLTLARAGRLLGVPTRHLSLAINNIYKASFSQYLNDRRVEEAKKLFNDQPELTVTEVMLAAGFATKSHFHREFNRVTGITPSNYRSGGISLRKP